MTDTTMGANAGSTTNNPFQPRDPAEAGRLATPYVHVHAHGIICDTDVPGSRTPGNRSPFEIILDASEGVIPLWEEETVLRWRFQERSLSVFQDPDAAKAAITDLFGRALMAWGDAAPVRFSQNSDAWDFEIVVRDNDRCNVNGCVLASAFFPDAGRHELVLYPKLFSQSPEEQLDTLIHEIGHIFGLRHFFALVEEKKWPAIAFGKQNAFTIMNYGAESVLTDDDRADLLRLYSAVWSGALTNINGTPIRLVRPFHALAL